MKAPHLYRRSGFTLLELLTVMAIIITLAGIILAGVGFAQQKAARERATAEIAGLSVALESYKIDNGDYPREPAVTDISVVVGKPAVAPSNLLYKSLRGKYFEFKADMLDAPTPSDDRYMIDPFGNPYGYSTVGSSASPGTKVYYNPTFDLWSTAGTTTAADQVKWITNW